MRRRKRHEATARIPHYSRLADSITRDWMDILDAKTGQGGVGECCLVTEGMCNETPPLSEEFR